MPLVVSDSYTLIHLAGIGRLQLLKDLYGAVVVAGAVWTEVVEQGGDRLGASAVNAARDEGWLSIEQPENKQLLHLLKDQLDAGEAETIVLAIDHQADLVLMDETEGRRVAALYGLPKTGVVGLLIRARAENRITSLRQELDALRHKSGFWISDALYQQALALVGE